MSTLAELKTIAITNTLQSCQHFTGLPPQDLATIAAITVVKSLEKGEYLFHEGDVASGFYVIQRALSKSAQRSARKDRTNNEQTCARG